MRCNVVLEGMIKISLFLFVFLFSFLITKSQVLTDFEPVYEELKLVFKDYPRRGGAYSSEFTLRTRKHIKYENTDEVLGEDKELNKKISQAVLKHKKLFKQYQRYRIRVFFDTYSDVIYAQIYPIIPVEMDSGDRFFGPSEVHAEPRGGMNKFLLAIVHDIQQNKEKLKWAETDSVAHLSIIVCKDGATFFTGEQRLISLLNFAKRTTWRPAIVSGGRVTIRIKLELDVKYALSNDLDSRKMLANFNKEEPFYEKMLSELFQGDYVAWNTYKPKLGKEQMLVSFVYNSNTRKFENPIIHRGETKAAKVLIAFVLNQLEGEKIEEYPSPFSRYFFYL